MYEPAEDSYLLLKTVDEYLNQNKGSVKKALDIGVGSGVIFEKLKEEITFVLGCDVDEVVVKTLRKKHDNIIRSNLFSNVELQKFDLITFNAPYLPGKRTSDVIDLVGGVEGTEVTEEFLEQSTKYLGEEGIILFVASSLSKLENIERKCEQIGYQLRVKDKTHIFFEDIIVYEAKWK